MTTRLSSSVVPHPSSFALRPEWAAKLGNVCTAEDPLIRGMLEQFQEPRGEGDAGGERQACAVDTSRVPVLEHVIAVGGSFASVPNVVAPEKVLGYIKIASAGVDVRELAKLRAPIINPAAIGQVLADGADARATVLPVGNVRIPGRTLLQTVRHALLATFRHVQAGALFETLEFLTSYAWDDDAEPWRHGSKHRPKFLCPFCDGVVWYPRRRREFRCHGCAADLTLVDALGLITDASESSSESAVAVNLKAVLEHLTLLTYLRRLVEMGQGFSGRVLLLRDGPLMLRGGAARLVEPVRAYLRFLCERGVEFYLAGVEREGAFVSHRPQMGEWFNGDGAVFVPENRYVLERIKHAGGATAVYGRRGLYGSKAFCRIDDQNVFVLSLPNRRHDFDAFACDPKADDLIGLDRTLATLKELVSRHFPGVPLPLVAVERLLSLPRHPTNDLLKRLEGSGFRVQEEAPNLNPEP